MIGIHRQGFLRADLDTIAAYNTPIGIQRPGIRFSTDGQRVGRTSLGTQGAIDAKVGIIHQVAPAPVNGRPLFKRVAPGRRPPEQIIKNITQGIHNRLPFRTTDTRVDGEDDHRHIGQFTTGQHRQQSGGIGKRRGPNS